MKKFLLVISLFLSITSFSFAGIMFQTDMETASGIFLYNNDCFNYSQPKDLQAEFVPISGFSLSTLYEFKTRELSDWHFFAGANFGIEAMGIELALLGGFSYKLTQFNRTRLELTTTLGFGESALIKGPELFYTQFSTDIIFCGASRIGLYGGIGIANYSLISLKYYREFGWNNFIIDSLCVRLVAGLRL